MGPPLKWTPLMVEGGNIVIKVDEDLEKEARNCIYDVIGRVSYQNGDKPRTTMELKARDCVMENTEHRDCAHW